MARHACVGGTYTLTQEGQRVVNTLSQSAALSGWHGLTEAEPTLATPLRPLLAPLTRAAVPNELRSLAR
jgi:hypothetical protein